MPLQEDIVRLNDILTKYKNNLEFAERTASKHRIDHYKTLVNDTQKQLKELEKEIPLESNVHYRSVIDGLHGEIEKLKEANNELKGMVEKLTKRIDDFSNPPKKEEPKEDSIMIECPDCGRSVKGKKGMAAHQRWCKMGH